MTNGQKRFSLVERLVVVAIILITASITVQNVLSSMTRSETRIMNRASAQYSALRTTYVREVAPFRTKSSF
jgi:type II secretory pathway pseudopilin PulG